MNQNLNSLQQMASIEKFKELNNGKLPLTSDIVFKKVFSSNGNEHILKSLLEAILDTKIKKVIVLNPELPKNLYDSKAGVLDVKAEMDDDTIIDIEMHFIELPKFKKKNPEAKTMLEKWLWMISGEEDKINMEEKENKELKETSKIVNRMSMTREEWDAYFSHLMAEMDYHDGIKYATEKGIEQGIEQGEKKIKKESVSQMLKRNMDTKTICDILQISMEEFENIKAEIEKEI